MERWLNREPIRSSWRKTESTTSCTSRRVGKS